MEIMIGNPKWFPSYSDILVNISGGEWSLPEMESIEQGIQEEEQVLGWEFRFCPIEFGDVIGHPYASGQHTRSFLYATPNLHYLRLDSCLTTFERSSLILMALTHLSPT